MHCTHAHAQELRSGIKQLPGASGLHLTRDEFDLLTEHGKYVDDKGAMNRNMFHIVITNGRSDTAPARQTSQLFTMSVAEKCSLLHLFAAPHVASRSSYPIGARTIFDFWRRVSNV